jgi:hypothetical protein
MMIKKFKRYAHEPGQIRLRGTDGRGIPGGEGLGPIDNGGRAGVIIVFEGRWPMSQTFALSNSMPQFAERVKNLAFGEELVLTHDDMPVAVVTRKKPATGDAVPGTAKNPGYWMSPDFNDPLEWEDDEDGKP